MTSSVYIGTAEGKLRMSCEIIASGKSVAAAAVLRVIFAGEFSRAVADAFKFCVASGDAQLLFVLIIMN